MPNNQCDGCLRRLPILPNGMHFCGANYPQYMACDADLYKYDCLHCNDTGIEPDAGTDNNPEPPCTECQSRRTPRECFRKDEM